MKQYGFYLALIIGILLILFGIVIIWQALPTALAVIQMPSEIPFVNQMYEWFMSGAHVLTQTLEQNLLAAFQAVLKIILLITFLWVCVQLIRVGVNIIKIGVELIQGALTRHDTVSAPASPHKEQK